MADIVFLVESVDRYGDPYTLTDRLKALFPEWIEYFNSEILKTYKSVIKNKIEFQAYDKVQNFDPNKKYFYFVSLDHFNFDFPVFFQMLGKSKLKRLDDNNIPLLFAHDTETVPHLDFDAFIRHMEWLFLMRGVYSDVQNKMIFLTAADVIPRQKQFMDQYFYNKFKFVQSPLTLKYCVTELLKAHPSEEEILLLRQRPKDRQFTTLNRGCRYNRISLLHGLRALNLMDQGYISVREMNHYPPETVRSNTAYATAVRNDIIKGPIPFMTLDSFNVPNNRPASLPSYPEQMWSSYYDVVAETASLYYLPNPLDLSLVTEKTAKSILFMRPFMINGGPYCLRSLKRFGFKTYDFMFDESYDDVENVIDRQEIIIKNISRYVNKYSELQDIIEQHDDVTRFNRNHALTADYEQLLVNELMSVL